MDRWPTLRYDDWKASLATLHLWTQVVGKIRLGQEPLVNHWWNVTLYVTSRGLTTAAMPYGVRTFEITFDFIDHVLRVRDCDAGEVTLKLEPMSVATFYERVMESLRRLGIEIVIHKKPNEVVEAIPFDRDTVHCSYDREYVERFWRVLLQLSRLCEVFRARFLGKQSPVHFFWGSFDLAQSRFSGRRAPPHPGVPNVSDRVTQEAYSHEVFSVGFWPGGYGLDALLYAYIYPAPAGLEQARVRPDAASWNTTLKEFVLPYEAVRTSQDPDQAVLDFFQTAYDDAADLARWDRAALERPTNS